ncbi:hypothetical protein V6N13_065165 [Hibiscus sabdariffa]
MYSPPYIFFCSSNFQGPYSSFFVVCPSSFLVAWWVFFYSFLRSLRCRFVTSPSLLQQSNLSSKFIRFKPSLILFVGYFGKQ